MIPVSRIVLNSFTYNGIHKLTVDLIYSLMTQSYPGAVPFVFKFRIAEVISSKVISPFRVIFILFVCLMVFNAAFNNISVILWRSVLLVEETEEPGENHRPVTSH